MEAAGRDVRAVHLLLQRDGRLAARPDQPGPVDPLDQEGLGLRERGDRRDHLHDQDAQLPHHVHRPQHHREGVRLRAVAGAGVALPRGEHRGGLLHGDQRDLEEPGSHDSRPDLPRRGRPDDRPPRFDQRLRDDPRPGRQRQRLGRGHAARGAPPVPPVPLAAHRQGDLLHGRGAGPVRQRGLRGRPLDDRLPRRREPRHVRVRRQRRQLLRDPRGDPQPVPGRRELLQGQHRVLRARPHPRLRDLHRHQPIRPCLVLERERRRDRDRGELLQRQPAGRLRRLGPQPLVPHRERPLVERPGGQQREAPLLLQHRPDRHGDARGDGGAGRPLLRLRSRAHGQPGQPGGRPELDPGGRGELVPRLPVDHRLSGAVVRDRPPRPAPAPPTRTSRRGRPTRTTSRRSPPTGSACRPPATAARAGRPTTTRRPRG